MELNKAIKVIADLAILNFTYEEKSKKFNFIKNKIIILSNNMKHLIFIEIFKSIQKKDEKINILEEKEKEDYYEEEGIYIEMEKFIFEEYANSVKDCNDINYIINFIEYLEGKNENEQKKIKLRNSSLANEFLKILIQKNLFTKEEFFSCKQNIKIILLYQLFEEKLIKENYEKYYKHLYSLLDDIRRDIYGNIKKKQLEEFLKNDESIIKKRLSLFNIILDLYTPNENFINLKKINDEINSLVKKLKYIKDNIEIYFKESFKDIINRIFTYIKNYKNMKIKEQKHVYEIYRIIEELEDLPERIEEVKNFMLFNVIYEINSNEDERLNFDMAYQKLDDIRYLLKYDIVELYEKNKEIFDIIREKLSDNEEKANEFIKDFIKYFNLKDEKLIEEITILFKTKKYERDINSIFYFFIFLKKIINLGIINYPKNIKIYLKKILRKLNQI